MSTDAPRPERVTLTPEERARHDLLAEAVEFDIHGEEALRCADQMMVRTVRGQLLVARHRAAEALPVAWARRVLDCIVARHRR